MGWLRVFLVLHFVVIVVNAVSIHCRSDPKTVYPTIQHNYGRLRPVHHLSSKSRRSFDDTFVRKWAIGSLTINETAYALSTLQRLAIANAYRFLILAYNLDDANEQPHSFSVVISTEIPSNNNVGLWDGTHVTLYINAIRSNDMLFFVALHEFLHSLAFGSVDVGYGSFATRTNSTTFVHNGPLVTACLSQRNSYTGVVYTDNTLAHWANDVTPFGNDVMEPILPSSNVPVSMCTLAAVIDTRPTWSSLVCQTTTECPSNYTCYNIGSVYLPSLCLPTFNESSAAHGDLIQYPVVTPFVYITTILFVVLWQYAHFPENTESLLGKLLDSEFP